MPENKGLPIFSTPSSPPLLSPQHTQLKKIMGVIVCLQRIQERTTKNEITRTEKQEPRREDQPLIVKFYAMKGSVKALPKYPFGLKRQCTTTLT